MKFLSDILAKAGLTVDGVVTLNNTATGQTPDANDNSTKLATTAWVRTFVQPYSLPIASASILGGIKVGTGLSIDSGTGILSVTGASASSIKSTQTFVVTEGQTVFTVTNGYSVGLIDIFLNGVYLSPNQSTATNGSTFTLNDPAATGDIIDVIVVSPVYQGTSTTTDQLPEGVVNLYYTNARARAAITLTVNGSSGASTYSSSTGVLNVPTYTLAGLGGIGGSGTTGYVSKFTNSTTIGNSLIYDDGFGIGINTSSPYNTSFYSLDVNGALLVKNVGKAANITLINADPAGGGNNAFVIHTVGGTLTSSYVDIQGYYGASVTGSTTIRLNAAGGNILIGSLIGTGTRMVVASSTGILSSQAIPTISDLSGVPTSRTLTINGVTYDLTANRSWSALPVGGTAGQLLAKVDGTDYNAQWINEAPAASYTSQVKHQVKASQAITKGQAVYVSSADGTNMIVSKASNATEGTSSKTMGLLESTVSTNGFTNVIAEGLLSGLNTNGANAGDPVWLGTDGNLIYGLLNKPSAPAHLVFIGIVTRANANNGEIFVKVQNGFELDELHNLSVASPSDGDMIKYVASTGLWTKIAASTTNIVEGTNLYYTTARANTDFDTRLATKSTSNLSEGTNLYYTDTRVGTYLTNNSYATQTYVNTAVSNLVDAAPGTLDTLNELAAALGDDPNFATTVATSIGTKEPIITAGTTSQYWRGDKTWQTLPIYTLSGLGGQPQLNGTGFVKVSGTTVSYDNSTYYLASNPNGYITGTGADTRVAVWSGTGTLSGTDAFTYTSPTLAIGLSAASNQTDYKVVIQRHGTLASPGTWTDSNGLQVVDYASDGPSVGFIATALVSIELPRINTSDPYAGNAVAFRVATDDSTVIAVKGNGTIHMGQNGSSDTGEKLQVNGAGKFTGALAASTGSFSSTLSATLISLSNTQPFILTGGGNTGTYTQTAIYSSQTNTSGDNANGLFIERGRLTNAGDGEIRQFIIGARGGTIQWRLDKDGNSYQTGTINAPGIAMSGDITISGYRIKDLTSTNKGVYIGNWSGAGYWGLGSTANNHELKLDQVNSTTGAWEGATDVNLYLGSNRLVLHSSNYSSYALPLSGGTLTGTLSGTNAIFNSRLGVGISADQTYASVFVGGAITTGTSQYAFLADPQLAGTDNYALFANARIKASTAVTNTFGVYIPSAEKLSGASIVNNYALYIANQTSGSSTNYSIYSSGGLNYFGGAFSINNTLTIGAHQALKPSGFGYDVNGYKVLIVGQPETNSYKSLAFGVDVSGNPSGAFSGWGQEYVWKNAASFITPNSGNNGYNTLLSWSSSGQVTIPNLVASSLTLGNSVVIGSWNSATTLQFQSASNSIGRINFYDANDTEGTYIRNIGTSFGGDLRFGARWDDDEDKIFFNLRQSSAGGGYDARFGINVDPTETFHVASNGITAGAPSKGWPVYDAELDTQARRFIFQTAGNNGIGTAGQGATVALVLGQYYDSRVVITPQANGGGSPGDQGTGHGKDLMIKGGTSDNGVGYKGGRLYLNGGMGYTSGGYNGNFGTVKIQSYGGVVNIGEITGETRRLNVAYSIGIRANLTGTEQEIIRMGNTGSGVNDGYLALLDSNNTKVLLGANASRSGDNFINNGGNFGINTDVPTNKLEVFSGSTTADALTLSFTTGADNRYTGIFFKGGPYPYARIVGGTSSYGPDQGFIAFYTNYNPSGAASTSGYCLERVRINPNGSIVATGDITAFGSPSDIRLKDIKEVVPNALQSILQLNAYRFDWKEVNHLTKIKEDIGVIAQEVEKVLPELARTNDDGTMSVRYQGLTAVLIEAIKEQQTQIEELKAENDALKEILKRNNII